ncbi:MAG: PorT family protein [Prevotella sp.]|nr:PorT family protein [Prevotella sp.]
MKKIIMIALMAIVTCTAEAQNTLRENGTLTLQPKIGAGFGYLSGKFEMEPGGQRRIRTGIVLGVEGEYYATEWLGIAAGVNYAMQGWKYEIPNVTTVMKLNYINIPLVANFYVVKGFALKTGVQFGFLLTAKQNEDDWKSNAEKFNFAIPVGISYEFNNFVIDARYNFAVSPVNKVRNDDNRWRSDLMQLTLGYKFTL